MVSVDPLQWFQALDSFPAFLVIACYFVGVAALLVFAGRLVTAKLGVTNTPSSLSPAISLIGTMASILIGLVIVSLWGDYRTARSTVTAEATEIRGAIYAVQLLGGSNKALMLADLRAYVKAVTVDEWPAMDRGQPARSAGQAIATLTIDANRTHSREFDIRSRVAKITELRATRISQMSSGIVWVLWLALFVIPCFLLGGIGLLNEPNAKFHYLLSCLAATAVSLAIFTAIELDLPYGGVAALSSAPIAQSIDKALGEF